MAEARIRFDLRIDDLSSEIVRLLAGADTLALANFYYRERERYIGALEDVQRGSRQDLTGFVVFAVRGLVEELDEIWSHVVGEMKHIRRC